MIISDECFNDLELKASIQSSNKRGICDLDETSKESYTEDIEQYIPFFSDLIDCFTQDSKSTKNIVDHIQNEWQLFSSIDFATVILDYVIDITKKTISLKTPVKLVDEITDNVSYWEELSHNLKYKNRFFTDIEYLRDLSWDAFFNSTLTFDGRTEFYRARIHNNPEESIPFDKSKMGSPEREKATPGRANSLGIPHLYLSESCSTTLYETRATLLDDVSIGIFVPKTEITVVDFLKPTSLFEEYTKGFRDNFILGVTAHFFRKRIEIELSRPMRRYDSLLEYIPTQFICEFIKNIGTNMGIRFRSSVHKDGINYVIFNPEDMVCKEVRKAQVSGIQIDSIIEEQ